MSDRTKTTIRTLRSWKRDKRKISMLTCYDFATARILNEAEIDCILVGDTYGEVCLGYETTQRVKVDHLVTITEAVRRGAPHAYLIGDMPYLSYQISPEEAIRNAGKFIADAGCDCVKVEVDRRLAGTVERMAAATIPVMAHLGLKPQSIQTAGGYRIQGKNAEDAKQLIEDAKIMEDAGAVALLLEAVPTEVAELISQRTELPVIGICAGPRCDGQVLVFHDMVGYGGGHPPRSAKQYAQIYEPLLAAFRSFSSEVRDGAFPAIDTSPQMPADQKKILQKLFS